MNITAAVLRASSNELLLAEVRRRGLAVGSEEGVRGRELHRAVRARAERIAEVVAEVYGVRLDAIYGRRRTAEVVEARHAGMVLMRKRAKMTMMQIGEWFGGRNHGTVHYALDGHDERMRGTAFAEKFGEVVRVLDGEK